MIETCTTIEEGKLVQVYINPKRIVEGFVTNKNENTFKIEDADNSWSIQQRDNTHYIRMHDGLEYEVYKITEVET